MKTPKDGWRSQIPAIREAQGARRFVEFMRKPGNLYSVAGYLVEVAKDCLAIKEFHWDTFTWNGMCLLQARNVTSVRIFEEPDWPTISGNALRLVTKTSLKVTNDAFHAVAKHYLHEGALVQIEQEIAHPGDLFLCQILRLGRNAIQTKSYDRTLQSFENVTMPYDEITKITFGDGYSKAAKIALMKMEMEEKGTRNRTSQRTQWR